MVKMSLRCNLFCNSQVDQVYRVAMSLNKAPLRQAILLILKALPPAERRERSLALCRSVALSAQWKAAGTVGLFSALLTEPDLAPLWEPWAGGGEKRFCYPRMEGEVIRFYAVARPSALLASRWNLLEPPPGEEALIPPSEIDLLFVPGVAFTRDGHRMGWGKGYYDRYLAGPQLRATTIGVCFREQIVPQLPLEPHDLPVARVLEA